MRQPPTFPFPQATHVVAFPSFFVSLSRPQYSLVVDQCRHLAACWCCCLLSWLLNTHVRRVFFWLVFLWVNCSYISLLCLLWGACMGRGAAGPCRGFSFCPGFGVAGRVQPTTRTWHVAAPASRLPSRLFTKGLLLLLYVYLHIHCFSLAPCRCHCFGGCNPCPLLPWGLPLPLPRAWSQDGGRTKGAQATLWAGTTGRASLFFKHGGLGWEGNPHKGRVRQY